MTDPADYASRPEGTRKSMKGTMSNVVRGATLLAAAVVVAGCASASPSATLSSPSAGASVETSSSPVASATASSTVAASASAGTTSFTSETYQYSLTVPAGWTAIQATAAWDGIGSPGHDATQADQFVGPAAASAWVLVAPTTKHLAGYVKEAIAAVAKYHGDTCPAPPEAEEPIKIGGEPGTLLAWNCGILINIAPVVHNGIGYLFGFRDPAVHAATDPADRAAFLEILNSVRL